MGNADTKLNFRKAVVQLTSKSEVGRPFFVIFSKGQRWFVADRCERRGFLGAVLVGKCQQCSGYLHFGSRFGDKGASRGVALELGHLMLQGGRETGQSRRQQLPDSERTTNRSARSFVAELKAFVSTACSHLFLL